MPEVTFLFKDGSSKTCEAPEGWSLMQIAKDNGIDEIEGACGGAMACATCHIYLHPDWKDKVDAAGDAICDEEEDMLDMAFDLTDHSRLGCQIHMTEDLDGLTVALPGTDTVW